MHGELGGVGSDTDIDEAFVGGLVVDPIGRGLAELLILEVVDLDVQRLALRPVVFLVSTEITGCPASSAASTFVLMYSN